MERCCKLSHGKASRSSTVHLSAFVHPSGQSQRESYNAETTWTVEPLLNPAIAGAAFRVHSSSRADLCAVRRRQPKRTNSESDTVDLCLTRTACRSVVRGRIEVRDRQQAVLRQRIVYSLVMKREEGYCLGNKTAIGMWECQRARDAGRGG